MAVLKVGPASAVSHGVEVNVMSFKNVYIENLGYRNLGF